MIEWSLTVEAISIVSYPIQLKVKNQSRQMDRFDGFSNCQLQQAGYDGPHHHSDEQAWPVKNRKYPFYVNILILFSTTVLLLAGSLIYLGYKTGAEIRLESARNLIGYTESTLQRFFEEQLLASEVVEQSLVQLPVVNAPLVGSERGTRLFLNSLEPVFRNFSAVTGVQLMNKRGQNYRVERLADPSGDIPAEARFQALSRMGNTTEQITYLDEDMTPIGQASAEIKDSRQERDEWFAEALDAGGTSLSRPYRLDHGGGVGLTIATPMPRGNAALGIDFSAQQLVSLMQEYRVSDSSIAILFSEEGALLEHVGLHLDKGVQIKLDDLKDPVSQAIQSEFEKGQFGQALSFTASSQEYISYIGELLPDQPHNIYLAMAAPMAELTARVDEMRRHSFLVAIGILAAGLLVVLLLSRLLSNPVTRLAANADKVRHLDFEDWRPVTSPVREIHLLSVSMEKMRDGLGLFGQYVPKQLVSRLLEAPDQTGVAGERRDLTVMFTDVQGFTTLSESQDPATLMAQTSEYFDVITPCITRNQGSVDKYIGDAVMAFWNAPDPVADHVASACQAALAAAAALDEFNAQQKERGQPEYYTRFGIATGDCAIGNVGSVDRLNYTAFGSVVNTASRLEGLNKRYGSRILVTEAVFEQVSDRFAMRPLGQVTPKGATKPVTVYELLGSTEDEALLKLAGEWQKAYALELDGKLDQAISLHEILAKQDSEDGPAQAVLAELKGNNRH